MKTGLAWSCSLLCLLIPVAAFGADAAPNGASGEVATSALAETVPTETSAPPDLARKEHGDADDTGGSEVADEDFGHGMQFGLRAGLVGGYRMVFRFDKSPFCRAPDPAKSDKDQQKFCGHGAPLSLDVALSFAPLDFVEPYVWGRFGLSSEAETNTESVLAFGAGARVYTMSDSKLKIYIEPAVGVEVEGGAGNAQWTFENGSLPEYKTDLLFHLAVGGQYDFVRAFGVYLNAGLTTGIFRYIHTGLEIGAGAQVRIP